MLRIHWLLVALFALATLGANLVQSGGGYDLRWGLVSSGGGTLAGGRYTLPGSIGQPEANVLTGGRYTLRAGFWQSFATATSSPTPTDSPTTTATRTPTPTGSPTATATRTPTPTSSVPPGALLVVNTTDDTDDGTCDAVHCSLREAINAANAHAGPDTVAFDIPPSDPGYNPAGWWTIRPTNPLPELTDDGTTIDATTQTANRDDTNPLGPEIELDGSLAGEGGRGIDIRSSDNVVRGLIINRFTQDGVRIAFREISGNRVVGNYIGTDARGQAGLGNRTGVTLDSGPHDNFIGGEAPGDGNLISGNQEWGISIYRADGNQIIGSLVGPDATGTGVVGNVWDGVSIQGGSQGNVVGPANHIAYNLGQGIRVSQSGTTGNTITRNAITSNDSLGIWLSDGGNNELAPPAITTVSATQVSGMACSGCRVEVFSDPEDEGAVYEGSTTADGAGNWTFTKPDGLAGPNVTATATDAAGNTSELSAPVAIAGTATVTATATSTPSSTPSRPPTATANPTWTATASSTRTPTHTPAATSTLTGTPSPTPTEVPSRVYLPLVSR